MKFNSKNSQLVNENSKIMTEESISSESEEDSNKSKYLFNNEAHQIRKKTKI